MAAGRLDYALAAVRLSVLGRPANPGKVRRGDCLSTWDAAAGGRIFPGGIYTKVAVIRQQQIQSPLDALNGKARPALAPPAQKPVGRMQIDVRLRPGDPTTADAEAIIFSEDRYVHLDGIVVREPQPAWVTLQVPPLEAWESRLCWLLPEQRERVETPEFFQLVQQHVTRRYLALKPKGA